MVVIDGKYAFWAAASYFTKDGHTSNTPEGARLMLDEITKIMNGRYAQKKDNNNEEEVITY